MRPGITDSAIKGIIAVFIILKDYVKLWIAHMDFIKGNGRRFDLFIDFVISLYLCNRISALRAV